ncbi:methionine synthase (B12-independent) [Paenibacillus sp. UNCCL117]|uniref:5-methyltetrahydropteroyltriglutamate-- homocysteine S-methyltransferase n=1 Tax=unclassified Paenibacillus TaxID=185978 RepID=UPI000883C882|nr:MULTISPECIES: 5-methyltetrahydropteroyltriglutamate--homocysteine S-methyltransferase [unclassified Paenibacillus]SDD40038.1 methionine synthase (B12-independent) [Paenibacillus sp. cl123]SFW48215.1 methionine synthase (B12-independent) [Paenibacillus sp. UNCCL117]
MSNQIRTGSLGYPRIGEQREWKKALEAFWAGKTDEQTLTAEMEAIRLGQLRRQQEKGLDFIPVNDFTYYDHMLDMAVMFGIVPARYGHSGGPVSLATYFAMARGSAQAVASEMTKWFNTNYHYIVPEVGDLQPYLAENKPLAAYRFAKQRAGIEGRPVIVGPYTFLKLSKGFAASRLAEKADQFLPLYVQLLQELEQEGVQWVQIDEPALVKDMKAEELELVERIYAGLRAQVPGLRILLQTYFEAVDHFDRVTALPVDAIGLDFVHDRGRHLEALERHGWPQDKQLAAGIIDGRNVWRSDLDAKLELIDRLSAYVPADRLIVQPSSSLLHVPVTVDREDKLQPEIKDALAFADQKLDELALLARAQREGREAAAGELAAARDALSRFRALPERNRADVAERLAGIDQAADTRSQPFAERFKAQQEKWRLPLLPTTTIGSFPQTKEVRQARQQWRKGSLDDAAYEAFVNQEIESCIRLQEEIGIDVLVHGEFERTDMVEFFGEKLAGFFFTANGWVQSYGSRCVKPPVIYADVAFVEPMTVRESAYAQSLTSRPVKGMLTGPVTILNWSFVRDDMSREQVTNQIALALRHEVEALQSAGIEMIQVDEPAVREGLPLKGSDHEHYLNWAVRSFRIATSTVRDTTQIHTHMCYCEFHDMIDSIRAMDADVISIETSRSHGELIESFELQGYDHGIGLGVYDIHSPRVPDVKEMTDMIDRALHALDARLFWINPDCGLKTRGWPETEQSLRNMVQAALTAREQLQSVQAK